MHGDLGYAFDAYPDDRWPGHPRLEVQLYETPTGRHFDPEHLTFPIASADGALGAATLSHPWRGADQLRACAGHIVIHDRNRKSVQAFSFGAVVSVEDAEGITRCVLTSSAPILELLPTRHIDPDGIATWFAAEVEGLLARRRAVYVLDEPAFARHLAAAPPDDLYLASLLSVRDRIARRPSIRRTERETYALRLLGEALAFELATRPGSVPPPALESLV